MNPSIELLKSGDSIRIEVDNLWVLVVRTDEGVVADVFDSEDDSGQSIASTYAFFNGESNYPIGKGAAYWQKVIKEFKPYFVPRTVNMDKENTGVDDIEFILCWEYEGEGYEGEFELGHPSDEPLLKFSILRKNPLQDDVSTFSMVDKSSFKTLMAADASRTVLEQAGNYILDKVAHRIATGEPYARELETLRWMALQDFR